MKKTGGLFLCLPGAHRSLQGHFGTMSVILLTKGESMKEITPKWLEEQEREILQQLKKLEMPVIEMARALFFQLARRINEYFNESEAKQ